MIAADKFVRADILQQLSFPPLPARVITTLPVRWIPILFAR